MGTSAEKKSTLNQRMRKSHTQSGQRCAEKISQSDLPALLAEGMAGGWAFISKPFSPYRMLRTLSVYSPRRQVVFLSPYFTDGKTVRQLFLVPVGELANCLSESWSRCSILQPWGPNVLVPTCISCAQHTPWVFDNICLKSDSILYWLSHKYQCPWILMFQYLNH